MAGIEGVNGQRSALTPDSYRFSCILTTSHRPLTTGQCSLFTFFPDRHGLLCGHPIGLS